MSNPAFYGHDISQDVYTMTETENPTYPLSNLKTGYASDQWRSSTAAVQQLRIDLGSAIGVTFCVVDNSNFTALVAGGTQINLQASAVSDWSGDVNTVASITIGAAGPTVYTFAAMPKRYWRLLFSGPPSAAPQLGQIYLGVAFVFDRYAYPYVMGNGEYKTTEAIALDGRLRMSQNYPGGRIRNEIAMKLESDTVKANWQIFFSTVRGKLRPFYFADMDGTLYLCHLDTDVDPVQATWVNQNAWAKIPMKTQLVT